MPELLDAAQALLQTDVWRFERDTDEQAMALVVEGPPRYALVVAADDEDQLITVFAVSAEPVPEAHRDEALRVLNRANHGLEVVSFEMDEDDGEVRARATVPVYGEPLVEVQLTGVLTVLMFEANRVFPHVPTAD